ncbi:Putative transposase [Candidatus Electrothrix aarhusensis]
MGVIGDTGEYRWSSYRVNGQVEKSELITPHPLYTELGKTDTTRAQAYRTLFQAELDPGEIDKIRKATNGNFSLGDNRFHTEISEMLGRRVTPGKAGRPKKE